MSEIYWGVVLDISDATTDTNAAIGLASGVFYWITGRPGYNGSGYTGEAPAGKTWKQGMLLSSDHMDPMIRMTKGIDISGGYGGMSGFAFELDDTAGLLNTLESNNYFVLNRSVDVYCFLQPGAEENGVSYHCWGGVVSTCEKTEAILKINCEDDFKSIHKIIPPNVITRESFPGVEDSSVGEVIPVSLGIIMRSKVLTVTGAIEKTVLSVTQPELNKVYLAAATEIDLSNDDVRITLKTPYCDFEASYFKDYGVYYLRVIKGTEQTIRILDNLESTLGGDEACTTTFILSTIFNGMTNASDVTDFNNTNTYPSSGYLPDNIWLFQVLRMDVNYIVSNAAITSYENKKYDNILDIAQWDTEKNKYNNISNLVESVDTTVDNVLLHPNISLINNRISLNGDIVQLTPVVPADIVFMGHDCVGPTEDTLEASRSNLIDRNRTTTAVLKTVSSQPGTLRYRILWPDDISMNSFEYIYVLIDYKIKGYGGMPANTHNPVWKIYTMGPYIQNSFEPSYKALFDDPGDYILIDELANINFIPNEYYKNAGVDNGEPSYFETYTDNIFVSNLFKIRAEPTGYNDMISQWFQFELIIEGNSGIRHDIYIKQLGFMGQRKLNIKQEAIYAKIRGEIYTPGGA